MRLLIYGSTEFAATASDLARHCGYQSVGMIDDYDHGPGILGSFDDVALSHAPSAYSVAIAIGYKHLAARWAVWQRVLAAGYSTPSLVHPRAYVADTARIGRGVMIMAGAIVDTRSEIGDLAVLWPGACINHDAQIGNNVFVSPNATLCGFASVGDHSFVGAGSAVADHCRVPEGSFIKMLSRYSRTTQ